MATYDAISTQTLTSSAASVTFSSIPQTYTDLVLVVAVRYVASGGNGSIQFNGDTGANYSYTRFDGNGTSATSGRSSNNSQIYLSTNGIGNTTDTSQINTSIQNYSNTSTYKTIISRAAWNGSLGAEVDVRVGLWRSTSAISSILVAAYSQNFSTGSTFTLYGIKAA